MSYSTFMYTFSYLSHPISLIAPYYFPVPFNPSLCFHPFFLASVLASLPACFHACLLPCVPACLFPSSLLRFLSSLLQSFPPSLFSVFLNSFLMQLQHSFLILTFLLLSFLPSFLPFPLWIPLSRDLKTRCVRIIYLVSYCLIILRFKIETRHCLFMLS